MQSFDSLNIVPALHRNTIAFIGMNKRDTYLATKVIKDKFLALDNKNNLFCWNVATGKLLEVNKLPAKQDYSSYKVFTGSRDNVDDVEYKREWYNKILLVKNGVVENFDEKHFYEEEGIHT